MGLASGMSWEEIDRVGEEFKELKDMLQNGTLRRAVNLKVKQSPWLTKEEAKRIVLDVAKRCNIEV